MPGFERPDLVPGSAGWLEIRKKKGVVTASNAGTFLGINEEDRSITTKNHIERGKRQVLQNYEIMKDPSKNTFTGNWFTRRGNFYEPVCFEVFEAALGIHVNNCNMFQSSEYDWLFATPDGLIDDETGWEVKNPWGKVHHDPPPHYMAQMQIQMDCSNRKKQYFMSQCIKLNCAKVWLVHYSAAYKAWMMPQLEYLNTCANMGLDSKDLDMSMFDFTPPYVRYEFIAEIPSLTDLIGEIQEFPEEPPAFLRRAKSGVAKSGGGTSTWKNSYGKRDAVPTPSQLKKVFGEEEDDYDFGPMLGSKPLESPEKKLETNQEYDFGAILGDKSPESPEKKMKSEQDCDFGPVNIKVEKREREIPILLDDTNHTPGLSSPATETSHAFENIHIGDPPLSLDELMSVFDSVEKEPFVPIFNSMEDNPLFFDDTPNNTPIKNPVNSPKKKAWIKKDGITLKTKRKIPIMDLEEKFGPWISTRDQNDFHFIDEIEECLNKQ